MNRLLVVFGLLFILAGCCTADRLAYLEIDRAWGQICPRYVAYTQADTTIQPDLKYDRIKTAEALTKLLAECVKSINAGK